MEPEVTIIRTLPPDLPERFVPSGTKGRILSAALVSFAAHGFYGTSIRTIADAAGINSATLYSHFPSKENILAALVSIGSRELMDRITVGLEGTESAGERLDAIITATVVGHAEHPLLAIVTNLEFSALGAELGAPAMAPTAEAAALLRSILSEGAADGSFDFSDLEITAHVLEGMAQQIPLWLDPRVDEPERLAREFVQIARRMTAAK